MTLSFTTKWPAKMGDLAGQSNNFVQKIWNGLISDLGDELDNVLYQERHRNKFGDYWQPEADLPPKLHTIRKDPHNRWKPGMKIHPVINNRSKDRFQFAPTVICTDVQHVNFGTKHDAIVVTNFDGSFSNVIQGDDLDTFAKTDGFPDADAILRWFYEDRGMKLSLIHWTDLRY